MIRRKLRSTHLPYTTRFGYKKEKKKGKRLGAVWGAYPRACAYRMPWESAICTPYPLGYVVVLIRSRSPTTIVVPPVPTNWALFVFHEPDVKDERAIGLSAVRPPVVVIVSLTADVVSPVGVVVINSVQFVPSPDVPILTPITRGP